MSGMYPGGSGINYTIRTKSGHEVVYPDANTLDITDCVVVISIGREFRVIALQRIDRIVQRNTRTAIDTTIWRQYDEQRSHDKHLDGDPDRPSRVQPACIEDGRHIESIDHARREQDWQDQLDAANAATRDAVARLTAEVERVRDREDQVAAEWRSRAITAEAKVAVLNEEVDAAQAKLQTVREAVALGIALSAKPAS